jgi:hypothetical protein
MKTVKYKQVDVVLLKWFWNESGVCRRMNQKVAAAQNDIIILHVGGQHHAPTTLPPGN